MAAPVRQLFPDGHAPEPEPRNATEVMPPPSDPLAVVRVLLQAETQDGHLTVRRWRGEWWRYEGPHWVRLDAEAVRKVLYYRLENAVYHAKGKEGDTEEKPWSPNKSKVDNLLDAMKAPTYTSEHIEPPTWLSTGRSAAGMVPCTNGLVDANTRQVCPATPDYFGMTALPIEYDDDAPEPTEWLNFLRTLWPDGDEEIRALQQWFGYVVSGRMDMQKLLLLVGPPRCGKGTIARILTELVGRANVAAPTLAGMATNFGLQELIGKTLAVVGDARLQSSGQEAVVERLLSITGQDALTIDRKNRDPWTGTLQTRFMVLSNELPKFGDASGAIASRFVVLTMRESFLGREDTGLESRIRAEFPGILRWALAGVQDLNDTGRIVEPASSADAVQELSDLVSPISAFLREVCLIDPDRTTPFLDVYREHGAWCRENGRKPISRQRFTADVKTRYPQLDMHYRPRKADGTRDARHIVGMGVSAEWSNRTREDDGWRFPPDPVDY